MDEHVHGAITRALRQRGADVLTIQEDGFDASDDPTILDRARELGRVVFTYDDDFLREATRRQRHSEPFAGVIFADQSSVTIGTCVADLELLAGATDPWEWANRVEFLPLR